jgi:antirestriction protein ArdC
MNVKEIVVNKILEKLEEGTIPWQKPWVGTQINYVTRKAYTGVNTLLLDKQGEYLTFNQVKKLNGTIKKGSKAHLVVFYKLLEDEEKEKKFGYLRYYKVFHIDDVEGIESKIEKKIDADNKIDKCEEIINKYTNKPQIRIDSINRACYSPTDDKIEVPKKEQFRNIEEFYSTLFHELAHSTGHQSRLDRFDNTSTKFASDSYSKEELVAEITTTMICSNTGIENKTLNNSVAYIQSWIKQIKDDSNIIIQSANKAQKAYEYIIKEGSN